MEDETKAEMLHLMKSIAQKYQGARRLLETVPEDFDKIWEMIENDKPSNC